MEVLVLYFRLFLQAGKHFLSGKMSGIRSLLSRELLSSYLTNRFVSKLR